MARRVLPFIFVSTGLALLAGCSPYQREERPAWRAAAEEACIAQTPVEDGVYVRAARSIDGPGICGLTHPYKVTALAGGTVTLNSTATLDCPMIVKLDAWIKDVVQPAAEARFGEKVVRINSMGSYNCRGINNMSGASLSEHSFGNAIDIGGFVLASGRELNIMRGFNGADEQESAFLHEAHAGACPSFGTVLGPGYNIFHYNHFHIDLAHHGSTSHGPRRYCKPVPNQSLPEAPRRDNLPDPPAIEEELDIARAATPGPELDGGPGYVATAVPPVALARPTAAYASAPAIPAAATLPPPISRAGLETPRAQHGVSRAEYDTPRAQLDAPRMRFDPARRRPDAPIPSAPPLITFAAPAGAGGDGVAEPAAPVRRSGPVREDAPREAVPREDRAVPEAASPRDDDAGMGQTIESGPTRANPASAVADPLPPAEIPAPGSDRASPPPASGASPVDWDLTSSIRNRH